MCTASSATHLHECLVQLRQTGVLCIIIMQLASAADAQDFMVHFALAEQHPQPRHIVIKAPTTHQGCW